MKLNTNKRHKRGLLTALALLVMVTFLMGSGVVISEATIGEATTEDTTTIPENEVQIYTVDDLKKFANDVNNGNKYSDTTVILMKDIDLARETWVPVGSVNSYPSYTFAGIFDGNNCTISNMYVNVNGEEYTTAGFFGSITGEVKNLTIDGAEIISTHYAGGIVGYSSTNVGMKISNCHVTNSKISSTPEMDVWNTDSISKYDNGDKVGGIIGYMASGDIVENCTVENTTISGYRDVGGIAGYSDGTVEKW